MNKIKQLALFLGNAVKAFICKVGSLPWRSIPRGIAWFCKMIFRAAKRAWPTVKIALPPLITGAVIFVGMNYTGLVRAMVGDLEPVIGFVPAMLALVLISLIPTISPLVGPGLFITILAGILTGEQIAAGAVTPFMALPAFCAIDALIGNKFIPRFFALGETTPETINAAVPAVFFTRLITIPAAVAVAYLFSFILFQN
jgi:PTS system glucitol/sorbitol-specific IIC component